MEFENKELGVKFTTPEPFTVDLQAKVFSHIKYARGDDDVMRLWRGAKSVIKEWDCKEYPTLPEDDLSEVTDFKITQIILWVGYAVENYILSLSLAPKNS